MLKFFTLTIIFDLLYSSLLGLILGPIVPSINENFLVFVFVGIISAWPAIATSAHISFKGKKIDSKIILKYSSWLTLLYFVMDVLFLFISNPDSVYVGVWISIGILSFLNVPVAFFVSKYYLKKYSI